MLQEIYEEMLLQKYPIGMRIAKDDRVWRYSKAGSALRSAWGAQTYNAYSSGVNRETNTIGAAALAGATTLTLTAVGVVTANMFAGGYACINWEMIYHRIKSNTGVVGGTFTVTLDEPLAQNIDVASIVSLYRNPYDDVRLLEGAGTHPLWASTVGIPMRAVQSGYHCWLQTWGPCVGIGVDNIGQDASERGLYFVANGGLVTMSAVGATANRPANQYAGYLLPYTGPGPVGQDQPGALIHFMLQLSP